MKKWRYKFKERFDSKTDEANLFFSGKTPQITHAEYDW